MGVCYKPPNLKAEEEIDLLSQLGMVGRQGNVTIMGDFSYSDIDWAGEAAYSFKTCVFLNVLQANIMCQLMDGPTKNILLDLRIANNTNLIADVESRIT